MITSRHTSASATHLRDVLGCDDFDHKWELLIYDDFDFLFSRFFVVRANQKIQPSRRWVHAFTLCGQNLRAWLFDCSGATSSRLININAEPVLFHRVVCGYALMDASAVSFDPSIKWFCDSVEETYNPTVPHRLAAAGLCSTSPPYLYATVGNHAAQPTAPVKLEINPNPLFNRRSIVTQGSVCWKARRIDQPSSVATRSATAKFRKTSSVATRSRAIKAGMSSFVTSWPFAVKDQ
ncbi:hypothetical protein FN846DRAFT_890611 [Sphaerosporella brunnea]|uniref:Fungal-type protein kinase domain-containing protein n=1 Tax=Sphaerosporella brunnea TaxID=1250544 RepID=A0A5J5EW62_9PEZI|nr:hypothetical protein FN846DRAFT_890611 [Sphaerosporella brunnea]